MNEDTSPEPGPDLQSAETEFHPPAPDQFGEPWTGSSLPPPAEDPAADQAHPLAKPHDASPRRGIATVASIALAAAAVGGAVGGLVVRNLDNSTPRAAIADYPANARPAVWAGSVDVAAIAERVSPAVVKIEADGPDTAGSGTGFILSSGGYIITNNHVVAPAAASGELTATIADGRRVPARLVGTSPAYDIAVIKVDLTDLPRALLGDSAGVRVGDPAIAFGSPLGLDGTVTAGIVSAVNRPVSTGGDSAGETSFMDAIQTDASINPGNSGGPLVDGAGLVIGVNSAIATLGGFQGEQSGSIGLGFAIPINAAARVADEIIRTGRAQVPVVGVSLDTAYRDAGAKVSEVSPGGPSDKAGLRPGDVVTEVNGQRVIDGIDLIVEIRNRVPGEVVRLTVERDGDIQDLDVTLGSAAG